MSLRILAIGEAMIELAAEGPGLWRQGVAGDTLNTAWYLRRLLPDCGIAYLTRLGRDPFSDQIHDFIANAGIDTGLIGRDPHRGCGLYAITLQDGERSFTYWRDHSAAKSLADDLTALEADVIYLSGITLAILTEHGREALFDLLPGHRVVFDPNIRPRLWPDPQTMRDTLTRAAALAHIVLPSFDDEAVAFGDQTPQATLARYAALGCAEIVVKNGAAPGIALIDGAQHHFAPVARQPVDTTGAGDSFNAGYLAARLSGAPAAECLSRASTLAGRVVAAAGALVPDAVIP